MARLEDSIQYVFSNEGGYNVDDGGSTNWGIVMSDVAEYRGVNLDMITIDDMKVLTQAEATEIYRQQYWDKMRLNEVDYQNVATCIFDCGVNRGISVGVKYAQRTCNILGAALVVDGVMGVHTLAAINNLTLPMFIKAFENLEVAGYLAIVAHNPSMKLYENGWLARAKRLFTLIPQETLQAP